MANDQVKLEDTYLTTYLLEEIHQDLGIDISTFVHQLREMIDGDPIAVLPHHMTVVYLIKINVFTKSNHLMDYLDQRTVGCYYKTGRKLRLIIHNGPQIRFSQIDYLYMANCR